MRRPANSMRKTIKNPFQINNPFEEIGKAFGNVQQQFQSGFEKAKVVREANNKKEIIAQATESEFDLRDECEESEQEYPPVMPMSEREQGKPQQAYQQGYAQGVAQPMYNSGVQNGYWQPQVNHGSVVKCPGCGEIINEMMAVCPVCGTYISRDSANNSVIRFQNQLMQIERKRKTKEQVQQEMLAAAKGLTQTWTVKKQIEDGKIWGNEAEIEQQKISLIQNFPVPNDVEEISEFIVLAAGNINASVSKKLFREGYNVNMSRISEAWFSKMKQMYNKAKLAFPGDPMFARVQGIYLNKLRELHMEEDM